MKNQRFISGFGESFPASLNLSVRTSTGRQIKDWMAWLPCVRKVKSGVKMEPVLNLAWAFSAIVIICSWLRYGPRVDAGRRTQLVALAVLILILFPVISVTDDLQAAQNPAEVDSCLRRCHVVSNAHSIFSAVAALPLPVFAKLPFGFLQLVAPDHLLAPVVAHPGLDSVQNRPPPAA
jgi:hypothetical protein